MATTTGNEQTVQKRVLAAADGLAEDLRADGWDVRLVRAGHVAPVPPGESEENHGVVYVVPDSAGEELTEVVEGGSFDQYEAYRHVSGRDLSLVTELRDPERRVAVVLVGTVDRDRAEPLATAARERGVLRSHVRLLDGTPLATFRHEEPGHFFPEER
jgi:hypothetical protein